jgi:predicted lysophospholipase L1 biosynthesis ABC-type transport system permease subunit
LNLLCNTKFFLKIMNEQLKDISEIRQLMERSSRFLSLSGLSGVAAGVFALLGAGAAFWYFDFDLQFYRHNFVLNKWQVIRFLLLDGLLVLVLSLGFGIYFTTRKARKRGQQVWNSTSKRLLANLAIPLATGGIFCLVLLNHAPVLIPATTLIFYGLALINGSKYTLNDVRYLGVSEIILGLLCGFWADSGLNLLFWAIGFGVLHIVYGALMYNKYDE